MAESRDPVIKLFGRTIQLAAVREALVAVSSDEKAPSNKQDSNEPKHKNEEDGTDEQNISVTNEEKTNPNTSSTEKNSKAKDEQNKNSNNPMDKTLKKPDKILPCPRCNSMETKFCYFNNYNVNQPRHFCKKCQRYWTEGGSIRNVPVGAGRRKSKSATTNHHITIPDFAQADFYESISHLSSLKPNGTVLGFGESMDPNGEDQLSRTLVTTLNSNDEGNLNKELNSNCDGFLPYLNETPWPNYPWSQPPFYPMTPYYWGMPWLCSGVNSTILGKHSREENMLNHSNSEEEELAKSEKCLWIPKTSRINDHEKAAKCSVWATLGFKNRSTEASQVLCANPAALSRSLSFQERS